MRRISVFHLPEKEKWICSSQDFWMSPNPCSVVTLRSVGELKSSLWCTTILIQFIPFLPYDSGPSPTGRWSQNENWVIFEVFQDAFASDKTSFAQSLRAIQWLGTSRAYPEAKSTHWWFSVTCLQTKTATCLPTFKGCLWERLCLSRSMRKFPMPRATKFLCHSVF